MKPTVRKTKTKHQRSIRKGSYVRFAVGHADDETYYVVDVSEKHKLHIEGTRTGNSYDNCDISCFNRAEKPLALVTQLRRLRELYARRITTCPMTGKAASRLLKELVDKSIAIHLREKAQG